MLQSQKQVEKEQKLDKPALDIKVTVRNKKDIAQSMKSSDSSGQCANSKD